MEEIQKSITSSLVATTRAVSQLANEDLAFHRSLDSSSGTSLDRQNERLLALTSRLLGSATAQTEALRPPSLKTIEDVEGNWRAVVDVVDSLLERADTALDEFTGAVKRLSPAAPSDAERPVKKSRSVRELQGGEIEKPQLLFEHPPTNDETGPFAPLLTERPHALERMEEDGVLANGQHAHPYQTEIEAYTYPTYVYTQAEPIMYHPFESTTATFVDTLEGVQEMLEELKQAQEIAIDLEHHDQRSYIGLVSLMQISTRDRDWIVDTLKPWRRKLSMLNEVFADPKILKVLHGAYMDVVWLQRDLGLYLVGLFDTHYASRALGYPGGSLAYLLKRFANVDAQKQYQMADWRIRSLPTELFDYARSDTHYLLYMFDNMRNELIQKSNLDRPEREGDKLNDVLVRSSETALQRYEHPIYDVELGQGPVGWYKLLSRTPALLSKEQFSVFRAVHKWRDDVARQQDDSSHFVMPNHLVFTIARSMPANRAELLAVALPNTQTLRLRADELVSVVFQARQIGAEGPDMVDVLTEVERKFPHQRKILKEPPSTSVAAYLPRVAEAKRNDAAMSNEAPTSTLPLRSTMSTFWGSAFDSSSHQDSRSVPAVVDVELSVPLPPLTAEVFADPMSDTTATPAKPLQSSSEVSTPVFQPTTKRDEDEIFILKQLGQKRKRPTSPIPSAMNGTADGMAQQEDEVAISDDGTQHTGLKTQKRKMKKEAKRLAKRAAAEDADATVDGDGVEEEPFDYANAPSMLHPPRPSREEMRERKKKEVNPYAKSLDAPKGLPRKQRERAGRSMTYKS